MRSATSVARGSCVASRTVEILVRELGQQLEDPAAGRGVELPGDLVDQQQPGPGGDRDAQRGPLLLAARELLAPRVLAPFEADPLEQRVRPLGRRAPPRAGEPRPQRDPVGDRLVVPERLRGVLRDRRHGPDDLQLTGGDRLQPGEAVQQRRLARAARPHHRDQLAHVHAERSALQRHDVAAHALVDDEDLARVDRPVSHGASPPRHRGTRGAPVRPRPGSRPLRPRRRPARPVPTGRSAAARGAGDGRPPRARRGP